MVEHSEAAFIEMRKFVIEGSYKGVLIPYTHKTKLYFLNPHLRTHYSNYVDLSTKVSIPGSPWALFVDSTDTRAQLSNQRIQAIS